MNATGRGLPAKHATEEHSAVRPDEGRGAGTAVVAVVLERRNRLGLFRRSQKVAHDRGRWHCITGYIEAGRSPKEQALDELLEETGLGLTDLIELSPGRPLLLEDTEGGKWTVHTFKAQTQRRRLRINAEHDKYRWVSHRTVHSYSNCVGWLHDVLSAVGAEGPIQASSARGPDARLVFGSSCTPSPKESAVRSGGTG